MARHGIPDNIVSYNGPQFSSQELKKFKDLYEFDNFTSSPTYLQSNGKAENTVKTAQRIMLKALQAGSDPYLGFYDFRNTNRLLIPLQEPQILSWNALLIGRY